MAARRHDTLGHAHLPHFFALIPAAGTGTRVGGATPKQYLSLAGRPMLAHAIDALLADARIGRVLVVVGASDARWQAMPAPARGARRVQFAPVGGDTRFASVRNGLEAIAADAADDDWVLVHDAARPCLAPAELASLIDTLQGDDVGGLLALPLTDTVKREEDGRVERTVSRDGLWRALTPQMFRLGLLRRACEAAPADVPTDEAMAIERLGKRPRLVAGAATNIKVTHAADLALAEAILRARQTSDRGNSA